MKKDIYERRILSFIKTFIKKNGYGPTLSEVAFACGIKTPGAARHYITGLFLRGELEQDGTVKQRKIRLPNVRKIAGR